ncbi:MAG TPA: hypothetical protein VHK65_03820 [Candidatus Dormibacteraeota bacterium]|nr:hypothetical protein [Candidatus Dormibacteraeota bacterium]
MDVPVGGMGGVPANATAAVINVTATDTTAASYLTVYPKGASRPLASTLNWTAGKTVPNLTELELGAGGMLTVYNAFGNTDVVFDVNGYWSAPSAGCPPDGLYRSLVPSRILDTRNASKVAANSTIDVQVTGADGVPASGVEAVTLNLTETNATAPSYITAYPTGSPRPLASNVNFVAGQTVPNRVVVKLGTGGMITLYNAYGTVDLVADVNGWFTDNSGSTLATGSGDVFVGVTPNRILDTRGGGALQANSSGVLTVSGVPAAAHAAVLNVTVTNPTAPSYLTVWPDGAPRPLASDLNFVSGLTVANLVVVQLGGGSKVDIYNAYGSVDVIVDVVGWYQ